MKTVIVLAFIPVGLTASAQLSVEIGGTHIPVHTRYYSIKYVESEMPGQLLGVHVEPFGRDSLPYYPAYFEGDTAVKVRAYASRSIQEDIFTGERSYSGQVHVDSIIECDIFQGSLSPDSLIQLFEGSSSVSPQGYPLSRCRLQTIFITDTLNTETSDASQWPQIRSRIEHLERDSYFALIAIDCNDRIEGWEIQSSGIFWRIE